MSDVETFVNKHKSKRVSIGMPVYNGSRFIVETLESVLNQTYSDFILLISDNASTDNTGDICQEYAAKDDRICYFRHPKNVGAAGNYERCFAPAKSEYFRWQNADDTIEPTLIEKCVNILDEQKDVVLTYGKSHIINDHSEFVTKYDDNLFLMQDSPVERFIDCLNNIALQNLMYGLIRREELSKTARMGAYFSSDINLIAELTLYGKFYEIQEHLFNCRRHEDCSSWDMSDKEKLREFWNPAKSNMYMQTWRNFYEYYKAVARSPIKITEKQSLFYYLVKHAYWQKNVLGSELGEFFKRGVFKAT